MGGSLVLKSQDTSQIKRIITAVITRCMDSMFRQFVIPTFFFIYIAVAGPGKINDTRAFSWLCELHNWLESLPHWCYISADCVYGLMQRVMIPFNAAELLGEGHQTYNFYLSQQRIWIEMAFGCLSTKWRKLCMKLNKNTQKNAQSSVSTQICITMLLGWHRQMAMNMARMDLH